MTIIDKTLADLAKAIGRLPHDAQVDVLAELEARIEVLSSSQMTEEQRSVVRTRMAAQRDYAAEREVTELLRRYSGGS